MPPSYQTQKPSPAIPQNGRTRAAFPEATVARLPVYLRALYALAERGVTTVASDELAQGGGRQLGRSFART